MNITISDDRRYESKQTTGEFIVTASEYGVRLLAAFDTEAERDAALEGCPKSAGLHPTHISGRRPEPVPAAIFQIATKANLANGGENETGIKRLRRVIKHLDAKGVPVVYVPVYTNSLTTEQFLALAVA